MYKVGIYLISMIKLAKKLIPLPSRKFNRKKEL